MTVTPRAAIVDAALADLVATPGLTPATTHAYIEPETVPPESCPFLAVWLEETAYTILTGAPGLDAYERRHQLYVAWHVYDETLADSGGQLSPPIIHALDTTTELILARIATWTAGMPGLSPNVVATLDTSTLEAFSGVTWRSLIAVTINEAS